MKHIKYRSIIIYVISILSLIYGIPAFSETTSKMTLIDNTSGPIEIRANSIEINNKRHVVTFAGNVEAIRDDMKINCQKIELLYEDIANDNDLDKARVRILEIIATEKVMISRPDGSIATAEKAVYYQNDEKVVLTGNPVIKQGADSVEGTRITLFLKEERIDVEKGKAILFPNE